MTSTEDAIRILRQHVEDEATSHTRGALRVGAQLVLSRGSSFQWTPKPPDLQYGVAKECFANAGSIALTDTSGRLQYHEGWVLAPSGTCIHHAWLVDEHDRAIDVTLRDQDDPECGYCDGEGELVKWNDSGDAELLGRCEECEGTGRAEHDPLKGTVYLGLSITAAELRGFLSTHGYWGVFEALRAETGTTEAPGGL